MSAMDLMTKQLKRKFEKFPLRSQEGKMYDAEVIVKYFDPFGAGTWLITEASPMVDEDDERCGPNNDYEMFGLCHLFEWEWGYVYLSQLEEIGRIERDIYQSGTTVREELKHLGVYVD